MWNLSCTIHKFSFIHFHRLIHSFNLLDRSKNEKAAAQDEGYSQVSVDHVDKQVVNLFVPNVVEGHGAKVAGGAKVVVAVAGVDHFKHTVRHLH